MEAAYFSETLEQTHNPAPCYNPEGYNMRKVYVTGLGCCLRSPLQ